MTAPCSSFQKHAGPGVVDASDVHVLSDADHVRACDPHADVVDAELQSELCGQRRENIATSIDATDEAKGLSVDVQAAGRAGGQKRGGTGIFFGWVVLLGAMACFMFTFNGHTFGIAWFVPHIKEELGLNDRDISLVWTGAVLVSAALTPFVGRLVDKIGPRRVLCAAAPLFGLAVLGMGFVPDESSAASVPVLVCTVAAMRFLGPNVAIVTVTKAINMWFVKKRGRVCVLFVCSLHLMLLLPNAVSPLILAVGWRRAYLTCGLIGGLGVLLSAATLLTDKGPLAYGLLPDGDQGCRDEELKGTSLPASAAGMQVQSDPGDVDAAREGSTQKDLSMSRDVALEPDCGMSAEARCEDDGETQATLGQALRTVKFWVFLLSVVVVELLWTGLQFNFIGIFGPGSQMNVALEDLMYLYSTMTVVTPCSALFTGAVIERARGQAFCGGEATGTSSVSSSEKPRRRYGSHHFNCLVILQMASACAVCALLGVGEGFASAVCLVAALAVCIGIQDMLSSAGVMFADLFGNEHLGAISGFVTMCLTFCTALGPLIFAQGLQAHGTEVLQLILWTTTAAAGLVIAMLIVMTLRSTGDATARPQ
eukprot:TRINITY_DN31563_c0_g1_i1.p1 TRINITY_DN31563_c0_g1~~TRINITY_DN31563_c0_g1_i1.p1  ORF type:complete len:595 (+),score=90.04 TRINITY_DN31563_c0_g1_i1:45-1829(+)